MLEIRLLLNKSKEEYTYKNLFFYKYLEIINELQEKKMDLNKKMK